MPAASGGLLPLPDGMCTRPATRAASRGNRFAEGVLLAAFGGVLLLRVLVNLSGF
ncbi:hypothetical protein [Kribbella sp.]|uniref:hypothetical protein n=1 Tax=Kribbella sp. TaxID=1871183 RepID=UPI002D76C285|nr:hypothetical protein [Kribbella sp.]